LKSSLSFRGRRTVRRERKNSGKSSRGQFVVLINARDAPVFCVLLRSVFPVSPEEQLYLFSMLINQYYIISFSLMGSELIGVHFKFSFSRREGQGGEAYIYLLTFPNANRFPDWATKRARIISRRNQLRGKKGRWDEGRNRLTPGTTCTHPYGYC